MQMMRQKPACPAHEGFKYTTFTVVLKLVTSNLMESFSL